MLERLTPLLSVFTLFVFFLLDDMVVRPVLRYAWYAIVFFLISFDLIVKLAKKEKPADFLGSLVGPSLALAAFLLYVLRNYLDFPVPVGANPENLVLPKVRDFLLLLIVLLSIASLVYSLIWEVGRISLELQSSLSVQKSRLQMNELINFLIVVILLVGVNYLAAKRNHNFDLSNKGKFSLSFISENLLRDISAEVTITAFYPRPLEAEGPESSLALTRIRPDLEIFFDQLTSAKKNIKHQFINADVETDLMKEFGQISNGTIVIRSPKKITEVNGNESEFAEQKLIVKTEEDLQDLERKIISAILTVAGEKRKIYLTTSNGERFSPIYQNSPNQEVKRLVSNLNFFGYEVAALSFEQGWPPAIPSDADAIFLLGPTVSYSPEAQKAILDYLEEKKGNVFATVDPNGKEDFNFLLERANVKYSNKIVSAFQDQNNFLVAKSFPTHASTANLYKRDIGFVDPYSGSFFSEPNQNPKANFKYHSIIESGYDSFVDSNNNKKLDTNEKKENFILAIYLEPVASSAKDSDLLSSKIYPKGRAFVFAGTSWATDQFYPYNLNPNVMTTTVSYLFQNKSLADIPTKKDEVQTISLSDNQKIIAWALGMFLFPMTIAGIFSFWVFRRRKET